MPTDEQDATAHHVLVVDDDPSIVSFIQPLLESEGYRTSTAANGAEAIERIATMAPDVVLLDLAMPVMSGWECARQLRERGNGPPLVFMSAGYDPCHEARLHGADGCIAKPFDSETLLDCIARTLARRHSDGTAAH